MNGHYILDAEHRPVEVDLMTWAAWFEDFSNRIVAQDETRLHWISTVFIGLDHRFGGKGPPLLFETLIFKRKTDIMELGDRLVKTREVVGERRYASWDDAVAGHATALRRYELIAEDTEADGARE